jgi:hypothetical protein
MDKSQVARELLKIARELTAETKDLREIMQIMPEVEAKIKEYERIKEEQERQMNTMYVDAVKGLDVKVKELSAAIGKALVSYFKQNGMGVRRASIDDRLVEVFIGQEDGVKRDRDSKVSTLIQFPRGRATYRLRNSDLRDEIVGNLSEVNTIPKLIATIKKAEKRGFWSE